MDRRERLLFPIEQHESELVTGHGESPYIVTSIVRDLSGDFTEAIEKLLWTMLCGTPRGALDFQRPACST